MESLFIIDDIHIYTATNIETITKLIKVTLGSGIFAIPFAYSQAGLLWGIVLQLTVCIAQYKSWCTMVNCLGEEKRHSLIEYLSKVHGESSFIYLLAKVMSILLNFGCGVSYVILFSTTIGGYFDNSKLVQLIMFIGLFGIIFSFSFAKDLQILTPILKVSIVLVYLAFAYLSTLAFMEHEKWGLVKPDTHKVMIAFGLMMFAYDINGVLTEIRVEMSDMRGFKFCLFIAMALETILYLFFGITSSLVYQSETEENIIQNYQDTYKDYKIISITLEIIVTTYVSILILNTLMVNMPVHQLINRQTQSFKQIILKITYVFAQLSTAFLFPKFALVLGIIGCVCCVTLGFVIPYGMTFHYAPKIEYWILNTIVVLFGIIGGIFGIIACF